MEHSIKSMCSNLHAAYSLNPLCLSDTHTDTLIIVINNRKKKNTAPKKKGKGKPQFCPNKTRWPKRHQQ